MILRVFGWTLGSFILRLRTTRSSEAHLEDMFQSPYPRSPPPPPRFRLPKFYQRMNLRVANVRTTAQLLLQKRAIAADNAAAKRHSS